MPRIYELDQHIADLIAAGEVVERPASVVKELMENSIDAGAGIITVEIQAGGMPYIRVTDNGHGIAPGDVATAFRRHATSKLRTAEGLEAICTLGFRGEALAAIAAVSHIEILTRESGAAEGVCLSLTAGVEDDISPAGCPEGTTIIVRDLFFNTPARLKFMKSDRAESSAITSTVLRCALSRPDVSVRYIRDGKTEYHTPGDSRADSCIYSLLGREFSSGLIPAESSDESVSVSGFISSPANARGNRGFQFFFVNGRTIQSKTLQAALEQAYANAIPSGRFPSCVLYITTSPGAVDVNVHPAKTEIKFISDKQVFDGVYYAALGAVNNSELREFGTTGIRNSELREFGTTGIRNAEFGIRNNGNTGAGDNEQLSVHDGSNISYRTEHDLRNTDFSYSRRSDISNTHEDKIDKNSRTQQTYNSSHPDNDYSEFRIPNSEFSQFRIPNSEFSFHVVGEVMNTYILAEYRGSVWFIDKHAAHERIHFDELSRSDFEPMSQSLITPVVCRHENEEVSILLENAELLEKLGFSVESFGEDAVAVRRIPSEIEIADTESILSDICSELKQGGSPGPAQRDNILRAIACKAALKAGKASGIRELEILTARVLSGEIAQCPHGRPVAFEVTKATLDRNFKRT